MRASLSFKSSNDVGGSDGLKDVMLVERIDEFEHIGTHHFPVCAIGTADLVCDSCLVISPLHQFEDLGSDNIEAKHLAVMNVEENSSIHCLGSPDCVGYPEHGTCVSGSMRLPLMNMTVALTGREFQKLPSLFASGQRPPANSCEVGTYNAKAQPTGGQLRSRP